MDEAPTIVYLNYVIGRPSRFTAAVVVRDSVGIVGWDNKAPICDTCSGSGERRRSCVHSKAFRKHVDKDRGMFRRLAGQEKAACGDWLGIFENSVAASGNFFSA